jgi:hypothetical protein
MLELAIYLAVGTVLFGGGVLASSDARQAFLFDYEDEPLETVLMLLGAIVAWPFILAILASDYLRGR